MLFCWTNLNFLKYIFSNTKQLHIGSSITIWRIFKNIRVCQIPFGRQWEVFLPWTEIELFRSKRIEQNRVQVSKMCVEFLQNLSYSDQKWNGSSKDEFLLSNCLRPFWELELFRSKTVPQTPFLRTGAIPVKNSSTNDILPLNFSTKIGNNVARSAGSFENILSKILGVVFWRERIRWWQMQNYLPC